VSPRARRVAVALAVLLGAPSTTLRAQGEPSIGQVRITGNIRVEEDAIRVHLHTQPGAPFDKDTLDRDIRSIYGMGFFDQVDADVTPAEGHHVDVTFRVKERPLVRNVKVEGLVKLKKEEVEGALRIRPHTILDPEKAKQGIEAAKKLYAEKGYLDAQISYRTEPVGENEVDVLYTVDEKQPVRIKTIAFEGNRAFGARTLRGIMQTKERWLLSPITGAGNLNRDVLRTDVERLTAWYYDHGYVTVKVDEPRVERQADGLLVTIKIDEGDQYQVGDVTFEGKNLPKDVARLRKDLATTPGDVFNASALRDDVQKLTERLSDDGYAFATVEPQTSVDQEHKKVDVAFAVDRGNPVTVNRIEITGNTKTRDYVIRREMRLQEQEPFSGTQLRKSRDALQRLGFFKEVNVTTRRAETGDQLNVIVDVKEGQTGALSAGAGFSSVDAVLVNASIRENNLFGRGQQLVLNGDIGFLQRNILLSFTEPYFRETPLTLGASLFSWRFLFNQFTTGTFARGSTGAGLQSDYPVTALGRDSLWGLPLEEVRAGVDYRGEETTISNLGIDATRSLRAEEGNELISMISPHLSRNTLNHAFDPTAGSYQSLSFGAAGLGGQQFTKIEGHERWYYTFLHSKALGDFTYSLGGNLGWGFGHEGLNGDSLPLFERYFPGGIDTIRGFEPFTLGPVEETKDRFGRVIARTPIGGSEQLILNNEIIFPIVKSIGLKGVVFTDAGNAYSASAGPTIDETRLSAGGGFRWLSPMGPLRVEMGVPFNTKRSDKRSLLLFSFGGPFQM